MSGPPDGKYRIISSVYPSPPIGAAEADQPARKPVLTKDPVNVWTVESVGDGTYKIYLKDKGWYSTTDSYISQVFVDANADSATHWKITYINGFYRIEIEVVVDGKPDMRAWVPMTVDPAVDTPQPIWISSIPESVDQSQLWYFLPVAEE